MQGAALESVQRLVQTFVRPEMRRAGRALDAACAAAAGCRFEETDAVADEAVYMQIVMLLRTCLGCDAGAPRRERRCPCQRRSRTARGQGSSQPARRARGLL
eukprot:COSAG01_NODE_38012_length_495_cov_3.414141_1_plen_101_part_10